MPAPADRRRPRFVLDASALLAYLKPIQESGAARVREALDQGAAVSTVNLSEVYVEVAAAKNLTPDEARAEVDAIPEELLRPYDFDRALAADAARIERYTRGTTIGLADRACLALGRLLGARVLTTEPAWVAARKRHARLEVAIENIRARP